MATAGGGSIRESAVEDCGDTAKWGWPLVCGVGSLAPLLLGGGWVPSPDAWSPRMLRLAPAFADAPTRSQTSALVGARRGEPLDESVLQRAGINEGSGACGYARLVRACDLPQRQERLCHARAVSDLGARRTESPQLAPCSLPGRVRHHLQRPPPSRGSQLGGQRMPYRHWFVVLTVDGVESRHGPYRT